MPEYQNVVISCTRQDLPEHIAQAKTAIEQWGGHALVMENLSASPKDAIDVSYELVDKADIYLGIFAHRYGYMPEDPRNPNRISITEMEYHRAVERGIPRLIFLMHEDYAVKPETVETGEGAAKLKIFKEQAGKKFNAFFESPEDLRGHVHFALTKLAPPNQGYHPPPPPGPDDVPTPGRTPPGSRTVHSRNINFVGREEDLRQLAGTLLINPHGARAVITPATAATGAGGIGKTQLAVEFVYCYGRFFYGVHWIDMFGAGPDDAPARFEAEVAVCGAELDLPHFPKELPEQVRLTLATWKESSPRLVILDNIESPQALQPLLPQLEGARVLITSRWDARQDWSRMNITPCGLETLTRPQSYQLLRKLAPHLDAIPDSELDPLAERLGDFPLALDLSGRYLDDMQASSQLSVAGYLERLEKGGNPLEHASLRSWAKSLAPDNPTQHDTDVAATFMLSWDRVRDPLVQDLFRACGHLAPNAALPPDLLLKLATDNDEALALALKQLSAYGLLISGESGMMLHPLLSDFARSLDATAETSRLPPLVDALKWLSKAALDTGLPATFEPLRPHVLAVAEHAETAEMEDAGALWNNLGSVLHAAGDLPGAREMLERALRISEQAFGMEHSQVAVCANNLGGVLQDAGDLPGAQAAYERALRISEAAFGPDHPNVAAAANNLGSVLQAAGDLPGARKLFKRALRISEQAFGMEHSQVAVCANNLGGVLQDEGDLPGARKLFERALRISEQAFGMEHSQVAVCANNLGRVLQDEGDLSGAREMLERALRISEQAFGMEHSQVAVCANNLGGVLKDAGDLSGAQAAYERALHIDEVVYGPDHPSVAIGVNNLGSVLHAAGDLSGARKLFGRALRIDEVVYGPDHPNVAIRVNNLGSVLQDEGDLSGAREMLERALRILEVVYGPDHPSVAIRVNNLGSVLHAAGDLPGARKLFERALHIDEATFGPDHRSVARDVNNLGNVLQDEGDLPGAQAAYERALHIDEAAFGPDHPSVARDVNNLGSVLHAAGDLPGARKLFERALRILEQFLPPDHPHIQLVRRNLAALDQ